MEGEYLHMVDILVRAGCFVAIILLGVILRRAGFFKREDFHILSRIVINITLPAAVITNFAGRELDRSLLLLIPAGLLYGVVIMFTAWALNRRRGSEAQAFAVLNSSGVNIGNFVLPFAQGFLGPAGVVAVSLFDVGNGTICLGGAYAVAGLIHEKRRGFSILPILRTLVRSVPFMTYVIMCLLTLFHINLPGPFLSLAGIISNANAFLAMLMLGVGFRIETKRIGEAVRVLLPRYLIGFACAALCWFLMPEMYRVALIIPFLGPVASAAPAYTAQLDGDYELASAINSFSILLSIVLIVAVLLITA